MNDRYKSTKKTNDSHEERQDIIHDVQIRTPLRNLSPQKLRKRFSQLNLTNTTPETPRILLPENTGYIILETLPLSEAQHIQQQINISFKPIDQTTVSGEIGNGNFGTIYLAKSKQNAALAVAKLIKTHEETDEKLAKNEMGIHQKLNKKPHANILPLLELTNISKNNWILFLPLMDYSLQDILPIYDKKHNALLSIEILLTLAKSIISGLEHLHKQGIVHFDLKPANVLLKNGQVFIGDFGASVTGEIKRMFYDGSVQLPKEKFLDKLNQNFYQKIVLPEKNQYEQDEAITEVDISKVDIYFLGYTFSKMLNINLKQDSFNLEYANYVKSELKNFNINENIGLFTIYTSLALNEQPKERPSAKKLLKVSIFNKPQTDPQVVLDFLVEKKKNTSSQS